MVLSRGAFVGIVFALFLVAGASVAVGLFAVKLQGQTQHNRVEAAERLCERFNGMSVGIRGFIADVAPQRSGEARRRFPITRDCAASARRTIKPPPG